MRLVLAVALLGAACHGGPLVTPGQVVVLGDTTLRTRERDAIEVVAQRSLDGQAASGRTTLHGMSLDAAKQSPLLRVAAGRAWLGVQQTLRDPARAYEAARLGIDELGVAYRGAPRGGRHIVDDTGTNVHLAERAAADGDVAGAATMLSEVLQTRIELYTRAFAGSVE